MLEFLIDECLSPKLAGLAREVGFGSFHVNWLELDGWHDQLLAVYAVARDMVLVTNNGADFKPIYRAVDVHPGLVVILPNVARDEQVALFASVLGYLIDKPDTINKLIEIAGDGTITIFDFPPFQDNF